MKDYIFSSRPKANPGAIVSGKTEPTSNDNGSTPGYRFTVLTDRLIRYEWSYDGQFEDHASTFAINREFPVPDYHTIDNEDGLQIITDYFHLSYDKKRFSTGGLMSEISGKHTQWGAFWRYGQDLHGNLGGTARTLDEVNGRCDMGTGIMSTSGYSAIDDSKSMLFDGNGFVTGRQSGDRIDGYLFCYGRDYRDALKAFYAVSGKQPQLPRWSLGNWWSRYYQYHQDEYIGLMDKFKAKDVPLSVAVVDMDWHLVNDDRVPHAGWTGYTWDDKLFPDPMTFGKEIHKRDLKITLNDHPHSGVHHHEDSYEEMAKALDHDTSKKTPMLFDPTSKKFMQAYLDILHRNIENVACDFWWIDWQQGAHTKVPGVDPLWLLNHFHFLDNARDGKHPLIFSRYAGPGSHRYPVGFSGDTVITWESLEFQPEFTATASNIGYGWWSHDIGGHMLGYRDDELTTRWVQLGVFSPIMRLHSSNSKWTSKEPWEYRQEHEIVISDFLRFRHRLIPFLHTKNIIGAAKDEVLVEPMYWEFPQEKEAYSVPNQYFFGRDLVVAPIVKPRDKTTNLGSVKVWIPPTGRHVDIFTGTVYDGGRVLNMYRPLEQIPVLAREGTLIPLDANSAPENGGFNPDSFEVLVVIGQDGQTSVIEDSADDHSAKSSQSKTTQERTSTIKYDQSTGRLSAKVYGRQWSFRFLAMYTPPSNLAVSINGKSIPASDLKVTTPNYPEAPGMLITCPVLSSTSSTTPSEITIDLGPNPVVSLRDPKDRIRRMLLDWQTGFDVKDKIWGVVQDDKSAVNVRLGNLLSLGIDSTLVEPVAELLLADRRAVDGK